jgi:hypothetical protein
VKRRACAALPKQNSVVAVAAMMTPPVSLASRRRSAHRQAASFAQLRPLSHHARPDLRLVRNEFVAKPHGVGRASIADRLAALGARGAETAKQYSNRQHHRAD